MLYFCFDLNALLEVWFQFSAGWRLAVNGYGQRYGEIRHKLWRNRRYPQGR
jgi:hypothetical protein